MGPKRIFTSPAAYAALFLVVAAALPLVAAHGHGHDEAATSMAMNAAPAPVAPKDKPLPDDWSIGSYYDHPGYSGWMMAHIVLMIVAWMIVLPVGKSQFMAIEQAHLSFSHAIAEINGC